MLAEAGAYAHFLLGDSAAALKMLQDSLEFSRSLPEDSRPFVVELHSRMNVISALLRDRDDEGVRVQLGRWRAQSIANLGLVRAK